jgi:hypothetical protein
VRAEPVSDLLTVLPNLANDDLGQRCLDLCTNASP